MGMLNIDNGSKRRIYAIAASLGMVQGHDHEDPLHLLVQGLTGKEGISENRTCRNIARSSKGGSFRH